MKFGIREVCNCHFEHLNGNRDFDIDTAKMSTLESGSTTVYAQGGRGFARLSAWEGEKTVTFTVEDALLTTQSLAALLGEDFNDSGRLRIKSTSFAGYYKITADTLVRNVDNGEDEFCKITIYKAKLQSNVNISMSPSGDPSTFNFTFDAFPATVDGDPTVIYDLAIGADPYNADSAPVTRAIIQDYSGNKISAEVAGGNYILIEPGASALSLYRGDAQGNIEEEQAFVSSDSGPISLERGIINSLTFKTYEFSDYGDTLIPVEAGSTTYWFTF